MTTTARSSQEPNFNLQQASASTWEYAVWEFQTNDGQTKVGKPVTGGELSNLNRHVRDGGWEVFRWTSFNAVGGNTLHTVVVRRDTTPGPANELSPKLL